MNILIISRNSIIKKVQYECYIYLHELVTQAHFIYVGSYTSTLILQVIKTL